MLMTWDELLAQRGGKQWCSWHWQLKHAARSATKLAELSFIQEEERIELDHVQTRFKTLITPYYLSLIDRSDPDCPIRRQALPHIDELRDISGERSDPIGDRRHAPTPLLVHRYPDRALLFPTFECPMFCRYCFRKETLNEEVVRLHAALPESLAYLREHTEIKELILSGGDPLMLGNSKIEYLLDAIGQTSIERLRIHSRMPVTLPQRIDKQLVALLSPERLNKPVYLVTHFNHPRELTFESLQAIKLLKSEGLTILNQSVLLRDVNDRLETLSTLFQRLADQGVLPYYLHHPDLTRGTHHLRVSLAFGRHLYQQLRGHLSGYMIPRYVIDIPGGGGKVEVISEAVQATDQPGEWILKSPLTGALHHYQDPVEVKQVRQDDAS